MDHLLSKDMTIGLSAVMLASTPSVKVGLELRLGIAYGTSSDVRVRPRNFGSGQWVHCNIEYMYALSARIA